MSACRSRNDALLSRIADCPLSPKIYYRKRTSLVHELEFGSEGCAGSVRLDSRALCAVGFCVAKAPRPRRDARPDGLNTKTRRRLLGQTFLIRSLLLAFVLPLTAPLARSEIALSFTGGTVETRQNATSGWVFNVISPINVTSLGFWDGPSPGEGNFVGDGLLNPHQVTIWRSAGTQVAQGTVSGGSTLSNGFRYVSISPVQLGPGTYVIGSYFPADNLDRHTINAASISTPPGISYAGSRLATGSTFPAGDIGPNANSYFGPNFQYQSASVCADAPSSMLHWWPADGNTHDIVGPNTGALVNGATFAAGAVGQAFSFDGVNDHVSLGAVNLPSTFTIDAWIKPTTFANIPHILSAFGRYFFRIENTGALGLRIVNSDGLTRYITTNPVITTNTWQHVAVTYDRYAPAGQRMKFYVNGSAVAADVFGDDPLRPEPTSASYIGINADAASNPFSGQIDELEIIGRALAASEIAAIAAAGPAGKCRPCTPVPAGMISWWTGNGTLADVQGNYDLTYFGGGNPFGPGRVNQALAFDLGFNGTGAHATAGNPPGLQLTGSAVTIDGWIQDLGAIGLESALYFGKSSAFGSDYVLYRSGNSLSACIRTNGLPGGETCVVTSFQPIAAGWTHLALTYDGAAMKVYVNGEVVSSTPKTGNLVPSATAFYLGGRPDGLYYHGFIDEVEVFDRALSAAEIQHIYNAGSAGKCPPCTELPPNMLSWWTADGHTFDVIGPNNGTLQNGASFAQGKVGKAFKFDGTDDHVSAGDIDLPGTFTIDAWINPEPGGGERAIVTKADRYFSGPRSYDFVIRGDGALFGLVGGETGVTIYTTFPGVITPGVWQHVAMTYDSFAEPGAQMRFYKDGVALPINFSDPDPGGAPVNLDMPLKIGIFNEANDAAFIGRIDEVEIFTRALGAAEIAAIYAAGSTGKCVPAIPSITITSVTRSGSDFVVGGQTSPNAVLSLEATPDMLDSFGMIGAVQADAMGAFSFTDPNALSLSMRFYRAVYP